MANASPRDAAIGYDYFWQQRGKISRESLNTYLIARHYHPISDRTYTHYRHLLSQGIRNYVPINRYDVLSTLGKLGAMPDIYSFDRKVVDIDAQISPDGERWFEAQVTDRSQLTLGLLVKPRFTTKTGNMLFVRLNGYLDIPTVVVWREHGEGYTRIEARATQYIASYREGQNRTSSGRGFGRLVIERWTEDRIAWADFYRVLRTINELTESSTLLLYTLGDTMDLDLHIAEPVLQRISFGSPGAAELKLDIGITDFFRLIFDKVQHWNSDKRIRTAEAERKELENKQFKAQIELEKERSIVETAGLKEDLVQKRLENTARTLQIISLANNLSSQVSTPEQANSLIEQIRCELPSILGVAVPAEKSLELFGPDTPELGLLSDHIIPAVASLSNEDSSTFTIKVEAYDNSHQ
jgi:hypothetical protein